MSTLARRRPPACVGRIDFLQSLKISRRPGLAMLALALGIAAVAAAGPPPVSAQAIPGIDARVVAVNIPGASAVAQIGTFLNVPPPGACANPIPTKFPSYILPGAILDPTRILVGST